MVGAVSEGEMGGADGCRQGGVCVWGGGAVKQPPPPLKHNTRREDLKREGRVTAAYRGQKKKKKRDVRDLPRDGRLTKELSL